MPLGSSRSRKSYLEACFPLRCIQRLSIPNLPTQRCRLARQLIHHWFVHLGPLVLEMTPLKFPTPTVDRDRTVSRRSEPSSRTALIGEQPNPWDLLQPQDAMSRHRTFFQSFELVQTISSSYRNTLGLKTVVFFLL